MALSDIARLIESATNSAAAAQALKRGWRPTITAYSGYGSSTLAHVLARVTLEDPNSDEDKHWVQRGYRQFFTIEVADIEVTITLGKATFNTVADRQGYINVTVEDHGLEPGWHSARILAADAEPVDAPVHIVGAGARVGIISDIDDTVLVTGLSSAPTAAWNSWIRRPNSRKPVPGMSQFYAQLQAKYPDAPFIYVSTGAWNTYDTLIDFLRRYGFPSGPLLLTDWGPTQTGFFRSGQEHKRVQLRNIFMAYPDIEWILIGDDGQHDPLTYSDAGAEHPSRVKAIAIRNLTPGQQLLAHGTTAPLARSHSSGHRDIPIVQGVDGTALSRHLDQL